MIIHSGMKIMDNQWTPARLVRYHSFPQSSATTPHLRLTNLTESWSANSARTFHSNKLSDSWKSEDYQSWKSASSDSLTPFRQEMTFVNPPSFHKREGNNYIMVESTPRNLSDSGLSDGKVQISVLDKDTRENKLNLTTPRMSRRASMASTLSRESVYAWSVENKTPLIPLVVFIIVCLSAVGVLIHVIIKWNS